MNKLFFTLFTLILLCWIKCSTDRNPLNYSNGFHIHTGVWNMGDGPREYKFRNVPVDIGFIPTFPQYVVEDLPDSIKMKVAIESWLYTSIEDAELSMVEHLDLSNLYMKNIIDFPLPGGEVGDNCWYQIEGGVILFIRNNVWVSIKPPNFGDPFNWSNIELVAMKIDAAIINVTKVASGKLVPAPVIRSVDIISNLPDDWGQPVTVKVNATDPQSQKLTFRGVGTGLALSNDTGIFTMTPDKSIPVFVSDNPNKFKIMIWVWNEDHLISLALKEFSFRK